MKGKNTYSVGFRRKREGRTDYRKRISLLKSGKARFVIRKSLKNMTVQIVKYNRGGDEVIVSARTNDLKKFGLKTSGGNIPSAYLAGFLAGKKAAEKGVKEAVVDIGLHSSTKGSRLYAAVKGAADSGLKIPFPEDMAPPEEKINGKAIGDVLKMSGEKGDDARFSHYRKENIKPEDINAYFESIKKNITGGS